MEVNQVKETASLGEPPLLMVQVTPMQDCVKVGLSVIMESRFSRTPHNAPVLRVKEAAHQQHRKVPNQNVIEQQATTSPSVHSVGEFTVLGDDGRGSAETVDDSITGVQPGPTTTPAPAAADGEPHHHHHGHSAKKPKKKKIHQPRKHIDTRNCVNHVEGFLWLLLLLIFHFICFMSIISMGLRVGVLGAEFHEICWGSAMDPFWATYIMIIFVYFATQLYFQLILGTKFWSWMNRKITHHRVELFFIPRILYTILYVVAIVNLYLQYAAIHQIQYGRTSAARSTHPSLNETHSRLVIGTSSTGDGGGQQNSPLTRFYDGYQHSTLFILSLAYMEYAITKENDWILHRFMTIAKGEPDPMEHGSLSNLLILFGVHLIMTVVYSLPLVGFAFMMFKFGAGGSLLYFTLCTIAGSVGVFGSFLERKHPFPSVPMQGPAYAYENHLRIRVSLLHYWLIPLAAGRFFNANWFARLDATNYDFIVFCIEVGAGITQVVKVISNEIFLLYENWGYDDEKPLPIIQEEHDLRERDSFAEAVQLPAEAKISVASLEFGEAAHEQNVMAEHHLSPEHLPHETHPPQPQLHAAATTEGARDESNESIQRSLSETEWPSQASMVDRNEPLHTLVRKLV